MGTTSTMSHRIQYQSVTLQYPNEGRISEDATAYLAER
jgi:hypothetical protein